MSVRAHLERRIRRVPVQTGAGTAVVRVGTLRAELGWSGRATATAVTGLSLPLGIERGGDHTELPWSGRASAARRALFARASSEDGTPEQEGPMDERDEFDSFQPAAYPAEQIGHALGLAASGAGAVGPVTTVGDRTIIPLTETLFSGGFGSGGGGGIDAEANKGGGSGGGGGGGGRSRTIALAIIGPDGVEVRPVFDYTGVALAALTTLATLSARAVFRRRRRRGRRA